MPSISVIFENGRVHIPGDILRSLDLREGSEIAWNFDSRTNRAYIEKKKPRGFLDLDRTELRSTTRSQLLLARALRQAIKFLSSLPGELSEEYMRDDLFNRLLKEDYRAGVIVYWQEIDERIQFMWNSTGFKALSLLEEVVACINSRNYFPALILTRARAQTELSL